MRMQPSASCYVMLTTYGICSKPSNSSFFVQDFLTLADVEENFDVDGIAVACIADTAADRVGGAAFGWDVLAAIAPCDAPHEAPVESGLSRSLSPSLSRSHCTAV